MKITSEQQAYINAAGKGDHVGVPSLAGVGKTSTGIEMCKEYTDKNIRFVVFAKRNAVETQASLPSNAKCTTRHSMCLKWLKRPNVNTTSGYWEKYNKLAKDLKHIWTANPDWDYRNISKNDPRYAYALDNSSSAEELISLVKNTYISPTVEEVASLAVDHGIVFFESQWEATIIEALKYSDADRKEITFDDMCRFPVIDKKVIVDSDIFILDEAQDSNPITIELVKLISKECEVHWFGDKWQSICGFMGAANDAMDQIEMALKPKELFPLTINFRCSKAVIEETRRCHPHIDIKAFDGSREGNVIEIDKNNLSNLMQSGDCVIARYNKIIIPLAFKLLRSGKRATIQGNKDFIKSIKRVVSSIRAQDMLDFNSKLTNMRNRAVDKATTESGKEIINDKFDTIEMFADNCSTQSDILKYIDTVFSEEKSDYKLSTAHRSKGLQFQNVFMMDPDNFAASQAKLPWQIRQEDNLKYVTRTRAQDTLYYVK